MYNFHDFSLDPFNWGELPQQILDDLAKNIHYVLKMEPGVAVNEHIYNDLKNSSFSLLVQAWNGEPLYGQGASGDVAYPDFYNYVTASKW